MTTSPVLDAIESRSIGQDAATIRFDRLERVRARQRARRRRRLILGTLLAMALAGGGVLGLSTVRGISADGPGPAEAPPERREASSSEAPMATTTAPPPVLAPSPSRVEHARPVPAPPAPPRSDVRLERAPAPTAHSEPREVDSTDAVDWLLKTSRTRGR